MLISSDKERKGRNSEKMAQLLNFLKEETYSDFDTLKQLFRYKAHQPLYLLLDKLEGMGLIQKYVFVSRLGSLTLLIEVDPQGRCVADEQDDQHQHQDDGPLSDPKSVAQPQHDTADGMVVRGAALGFGSGRCCG